MHQIAHVPPTPQVIQPIPQQGDDQMQAIPAYPSRSYADPDKPIYKIPSSIDLLSNTRNQRYREPRQLRPIPEKSYPTDYPRRRKTPDEPDKEETTSSPRRRLEDSPPGSTPSQSSADGSIPLPIVQPYPVVEPTFHYVQQPAAPDPSSSESIPHIDISGGDPPNVGEDDGEDDELTLHEFLRFCYG